jgi:hypothetical protein
MAHTARSFTFQTFEGGSGAVVNGHGGAERLHSLGESWLESLHKQHVSAREKRNVDVAQAKLLRRELVTFFGLYRRDDLGRADDLLREWKGGRELEDINRELKKQYQVLIERERERRCSDNAPNQHTRVSDRGSSEQLGREIAPYRNLSDEIESLPGFSELLRRTLLTPREEESARTRERER